MIQTNVYIDWSEFKAYFDDHLVPFKMIESNAAYDLLMSDGAITASTRIIKDEGADQIDFEANYKARANLEFPNYSVVLNLRQSAGTAANATVFAMRNAVGSGRVLVIEKMHLLMSFDAGTPLLGPSSLKYYLVGFSGATPTGGSALAVAALKTSNPATVVTDARAVDTGLTTAGVSFGNPVCTIGCPASAGATSRLVYNGPKIEIASGEGLAIRLAATAVAGQALTGGIFWSEK